MLFLNTSLQKKIDFLEEDFPLKLSCKSMERTRKWSYKYWRLGNAPSWGTRNPESPAFPRSLQFSNKAEFSQETTFLGSKKSAEVITRWQRDKGAKREECLHPRDAVLAVASNVKPGAWIEQRWIPALKYIFRVYQFAFPGIKSIPCWGNKCWVWKTEILSTVLDVNYD